MLLLAGDAGIGKTALLAEVTRRTSAERVIVGHCVGEGAASLSYVPFVEAFGRLDTEAPEVMDAVVAECPGLARLLPRRAVGEWSSPSAGMAEVVHTALESLARIAPVLVVIEDLHWADDSTRDLLTLLFTRGFSGPVSLVASYRSDDLHRRHPLRSSLVVWSRVRRLARLEVPPLDDRSMGRIVQEAQGRPLEPGVVAGLVRRADGNPFFAQELAAAAGRGAGAEAEDLSRLLLARIEQLPEEAQEVVRIASVVGRRLTHGLIAAVADLPDVELDRRLRLTVEHHILEPTRDGGYAFRHALLAEAAYEDLLPGERTRYHRVCALALAAAPELGTPADLARHALAAQENDLAFDSSVAAGHRAVQMGGPAEALRHFENALRLRPEEPQLPLVLAAADAATACGRISRAVELLTAATARDDLSPAERARAIGRYLSTVRFTDRPVHRVALVDEALALAADDEPLRAELLLRRVEALLDERRRDEALAQAEECLRLADRLGLLDVQFDLDTVVARILAHRGEAELSLRRLQRSVEDRGDRTDLGVLRAMYTIASIHYQVGNLPQALRVHSACARRAGEVGLQTAPYALASRASAVGIAYELGDWEEALRLSDHSAETLPEEAAVALDAPRGYVLAARGGSEPVAWLDRIRRWWPSDGLYAIQSAAACIDAYGFAGDLDAAVRVHADVVAHVRALWQRDVIMAQVRLDALLLGQIAQALVDLARPVDPGLDVLVDGLLQDAEAVWGPGSSLPPPDLEGQAWLARARAEAAAARGRLGVPGDTASGDLGEVAARYREAADLFGRRGDVYEEARCRTGLAHALLDRGERQEAVDLLAGAREVAVRLRATPLIERIDALTPAQAASVSTSPSASTNPGEAPGIHLTEREAEVLTHLHRGQSNGEIAAELVISTKTVSVHVSRILAKLGARSRGEAVAIARDRGLLP